MPAQSSVPPAFPLWGICVNLRRMSKESQTGKAFSFGIGTGDSQNIEDLLREGEAQRVHNNRGKNGEHGSQFAPKGAAVEVKKAVIHPRGKNEPFLQGFGK